MIDWVSIVRHSHRRFSNYMYGVPSKVRRRRQKFIKREQQANTNGTASGSSSMPHGSNCSCCWAGDKVQQKSRYAEDDMPPPPSPPQQHPAVTAAIAHEGSGRVSRQGSLERGSTTHHRTRPSNEIAKEQMQNAGNDSWQGNDSDQKPITG
uniref:Uncharacterized protein LOC114341041 n=1 Tax=Diabrotica virgifera virgifera TaxID=50390 RepID=A0A6P7GUV3_DIAVI